MRRLLELLPAAEREGGREHVARRVLFDALVALGAVLRRSGARALAPSPRLLCLLGPVCEPVSRPRVPANPAGLLRSGPPPRNDRRDSLPSPLLRFARWQVFLAMLVMVPLRFIVRWSLNAAHAG